MTPALARSVPTQNSVGPIDGGALIDDIQINKWNIEAMSVTDKAIAPSSVSTEKIQVGAVTVTTIEDGAITTDKIAAYAVNADRIATNAVTADKINASAVTATKIDTGAVTSTKISVSNLADINTLFAGSITISAASGGGEPTTGVYVTSTRIMMKASSVVMVDINAGTGYYYFKGELYATKVTVESNSNNSVNFGADVTIDGSIIMTPTAGSKTVYIKNATTGPTISLMWLGNASYFNATNHYISSTGSSSFASGADLDIDIGTTSSDLLRLRRGTTTVMSFAGNDSTVTFAGGVLVGSGSAGSGLLYLGNDLTNYLYYSNDGKLTWISGDGQDTFQTQDVIAINHYVGTSTSSPRISTGTTAPSGGADGDLYIRTGTTNSGASRLYQNVGGTWKSIYAVPV